MPEQLSSLLALNTVRGPLRTDGFGEDSGQLLQNSDRQRSVLSRPSASRRASPKAGCSGNAQKGPMRDAQCPHATVRHSGDTFPFV
jgi:hypothetical protein